jgi:endogenous inhibitor of DNA gyrase (YacG/DUF329 family)
MKKNRCPICNKIVIESAQAQPEKAKYFPFCSERCKLVDLGGWLNAEYKIISEHQSQEPIEPPDSSS